MNALMIGGVFVIIYQAITAFLVRGIKLNTKALVLGAVTCGITVVLASIYIPIPTGATITMGSMIPILLLAICYDYKLAMIVGWITGIMVMIIIPVWQPVHIAQIFVEHLICFSCLGYAGVFGRDKRWRVLAGLGLAIVIKFFAHVISGVIFFSQNAWEGWGAWGYSLTYHISSKVPEGIITTIIVMAIPLTLMAKSMKGEIK